MATYIKTLKEDNGDIVYPQTTTDAIYTTGGETLETRISKYVTAEDIAQSVASFGTVTTGMIADDAITAAKINDGAVTTVKIDDEAVTSSKIDWDTIPNNVVNSSIGWVTLPATAATISITEAGKYLIIGTAYFDSSSSGVALQIRNGSTILSQTNSSLSGYFGLATFTLEDLAVNDSINLYCSGSGRVAGVATYTKLALIRVG